jgi:hypothetical protein
MLLAKRSVIKAAAWPKRKELVGVAKSEDV